MADYVIDATDLLVGRLATVAATAALHGKKVQIVNSEKAVVSGKRRMVIAAWKRKYSMGVPKKGPFIHRHPDRFLRRIIRGMLPYKNPRGKEAFKNVMCYIGVPEEFKEAKTVKIKEAEVSKLPNTRYVTVGLLCRELGGTYE